RQMQQARTRGQLLRDEADYQLHIIDLWYEDRPDRALELLRALRERHPRNPHFQQRIAEVEDGYLHDVTASLRSWSRLLEAAHANQVERPEIAETRARLGVAAQLDRLDETDRAIDHLRAVVRMEPSAPFGALAR